MDQYTEDDLRTMAYDQYGFEAPDNWTAEEIITWMDRRDQRDRPQEPVPLSPRTRPKSPITVTATVTKTSTSPKEYGINNLQQLLSSLETTPRTRETPESPKISAKGGPKGSQGSEGSQQKTVLDSVREDARKAPVVNPDATFQSKSKIKIVSLDVDAQSAPLNDAQPLVKSKPRQTRRPRKVLSEIRTVGSVEVETGEVEVSQTEPQVDTGGETRVETIVETRVETTVETVPEPDVPQVTVETQKPAVRPNSGTILTGPPVTNLVARKRPNSPFVTPENVNKVMLPSGNAEMNPVGYAPVAETVPTVKPSTPVTQTKVFDINNIDINKLVPGKSNSGNSYNLKEVQDIAKLLNIPKGQKKDVLVNKIREVLSLRK